MQINQISQKIIHCSYLVHKRLGPGLLESIYQECLCYELRKAHLSVLKQVPMPVIYDDLKLESGFRLDLLVEDQVIVEIKSVENLHEVYFAQTLTYLKLANRHLGLLINFNVPLIKNGIRRIVHNL
ncbi:MAG: GxxExxY protein [Flavobacteriales bacterium]|nr:GxxExxY protein [Bacteroidota bacterium]MCB9240029.1 GxxExxY protein [Flavobacteriales bacterium]